MGDMLGNVDHINSKRIKGEMLFNSFCKLVFLSFVKTVRSLLLG